MGERGSQSLDETSYRHRQWSKVSDTGRDGKYGEQFSSVAAGTGIKELKTPYRAPKPNAFIEREMGEHEARLPGSRAGVAPEPI